MLNNYLQLNEIMACVMYNYLWIMQINKRPMNVFLTACSQMNGDERSFIFWTDQKSASSLTLHALLLIKLSHIYGPIYMWDETCCRSSLGLFIPMESTHGFGILLIIINLYQISPCCLSSTYIESNLIWTLVLDSAVNGDTYRS